MRKPRRDSTSPDSRPRGGQRGYRNHNSFRNMTCMLLREESGSFFSLVAGHLRVQRESITEEEPRDSQDAAKKSAPTSPPAKDEPRLVPAPPPKENAWARRSQTQPTAAAAKVCSFLSAQELIHNLVSESQFSTFNQPAAASSQPEAAKSDNDVKPAAEASSKAAAAAVPKRKTSDSEVNVTIVSRWTISLNPQ